MPAKFLLRDVLTMSITRCNFNSTPSNTPPGDKPGIRRIPRTEGSRFQAPRGIDLLHTGEFSTQQPEEEPANAELSPADETDRHIASNCPHHQAIGLQ